MQKIIQLTQFTGSNKQPDYALNRSLQTMLLSMIVKNKFLLLVYLTYIYNKTILNLT